MPIWNMEPEQVEQINALALEYYSGVEDRLYEHRVRPSSRVKGLLKPNIVDYITYWCPVRHEPSMALLDANNHYWSGLKWHEGGWYTGRTRDEDGGQDYSDMTPVAFGCAWMAAKSIMTWFNTAEYASNLGTEDAYFAIEEDLWSKPSAKYKMDRALQIYLFDTEYGVGAWNTTIKLARHRHITRVSQLSRHKQEGERWGSNARS